MKRTPRGFSLVELMIAIAIIGVLAALSIYGVRRYLDAAKASEAKHAIGNLARSAQAAFERERVPAEAVGEGGTSSLVSHQLCASAAPVPSFVPKGTKYQPSTAEGTDFETGDALTGWNCLKFRIDQPVYYQYHYTRDGSPVAPGSNAPCSADCFEAGAMGDLDGDGDVARFARTGQINTATGVLKLTTQIYVEDEGE